MPVTLTRNSDISLDSAPRAKKVKESGAKYCISNHINAGGGKGVETIHSIYSDGKLAKKIHDAIVACGQIGRRVFTRTLPDNAKRDYYYMHRDTGAVDTTIVEYGFIDNAEDVARIQSNWKIYAEAVVKAFCEYINYPYTPPNIKDEDKNNDGDDKLQHWTKVDHDELLKEGWINTDHSHELNSPISWGAALSLFNRLRKAMENGAIKPTPTNPPQPTEPVPEPSPPTLPQPDPTPTPDTKPEEPSQPVPVQYPPCYLNIPNTPCTRPDGTIDWKRQEPQPTTPTNPAPNPTTPTQPETPKPSPTPQPEVPVGTPKDWSAIQKMAEDTSVYFQVNLMNGTGVLLKDGYILTAKHVAAISKMKVQLKSGTWYDVELVSQHPDKDVDIALCRIIGKVNYLPYLLLSNKGIKTDQKLLSVGHGGNKKWVKKEGVVVRENVANQPWEFDCSLPLEKDDSGSGLVNEYGEVVGIAVQRTKVIVGEGSTSTRVDGAEVVNVNHPVITNWLRTFI